MSSSLSREDEIVDLGNRVGWSDVPRVTPDLSRSPEIRFRVVDTGAVRRRGDFGFFDVRDIDFFDKLLAIASLVRDRCHYGPRIKRVCRYQKGKEPIGFLNKISLLSFP